MIVPPPLPLQQHPLFAAGLRRMGRDVCNLELPEAENIVAVRVFGQLMASRGPVWRGSPERAAQTAALARTGLRFVNADTVADAGLQNAGFRKLATGGSVAELDLRATDDARLAAAHGKWRNRWRRAMDAPVTQHITEFSHDRHRWLLQADLAQQRAKRFRGMPHELILAIAAADSAAVQVHMISRAGTPLAAMLFVLHAPVVTYHLGWISDTGRTWGLHHRILLDAATSFAAQGYTRLDLGGVDTDNAPNLARFKIGSGARVRMLGGSWLRIGGAGG